MDFRFSRINIPRRKQRGMLFSCGVGLWFNTFMTAAEPRGIKPSPRIKKHSSRLDAVIDCTGNTGLINQAIDALAAGGTLVFVGMVASELAIPGFMYRVVYRELVLTGIFGRRLYTTWDILDGLLESGRVKLEHYVGETLALKDYEKGLEHFSALKGRAVLLPEEN